MPIAVKYENKPLWGNAYASVFNTEAKGEGVKLKAYPKISFQISIKGDKEMDYRIETKEAFDVFGIETVCSLKGEEGYVRAEGPNFEIYAWNRRKRIY